MDDGLDAPAVVRSLFCAGALGLAIGGLALAGIVPPELVARLGGVVLRFPLVGMRWGIGVSGTGLTSLVGTIGRFFCSAASSPQEYRKRWRTTPS